MATKTKKEIVQYEDDKIITKESDIEKIQAKPNIHISFRGEAGALHLAKEIINNAIDEGLNEKSTDASTIKVILDVSKNQIFIMDDGRGIPHDKLVLVCSELQSGSKMDRDDGGGGSAGENGVGLTVVRALSNKFVMISNWRGKKGIITCVDGHVVPNKNGEEVTVEEGETSEHGTKVIFTPSPFYLSNGDELPNFQPNKLETWLRQISYTLPDELTVELEIIPENGPPRSYSYDGREGLTNFLDKEMKTKYIQKDPVHFTGETHFEEEYRGDMYSRFLALEMAFNYDMNEERVDEMGSQPITKGFCNFIFNDHGGTHVDTALDCIVNYLTKMTRRALTEKEAEKLKIAKTDILTDLDLVINISTNANPEFTAQTKGEVNSTTLIPHIKDIVNAGIENYFDRNPKRLAKMIQKIKTTAKARSASTRERKAITRRSTNPMDEYVLKNFSPANDRSKKGYREVYIIEGDSAGSTAKTARFQWFQAILQLRGKPINVLNSKTDRIFTNQEFLSLAEHARCGYGANCKVEDSWFQKYIIMTDADSDGKAIAGLTACIFLFYFTPLVMAGMVYKAEPPLYEIESEDGTTVYVTDKGDYNDKFYKTLAKNVKLVSTDTGAVVEGKLLKEFARVNKRYLYEVNRLAKFYSVHADIAEFVAIHYGEDDFIDNLTEKFPEMSYNNNGIIGVYEGEFQVMNFINIERRIKRVHDFAHSLNNGHYTFKIFDINRDGVTATQIGGDDNYIGKVLNYCEKYRPRIKKRFKGLGEMDKEDLTVTTLDPKHRKLIQLTCKDLEADIEIFRTMHSGTGYYKEIRKQIISDFEIDIDELDD